MWSFARRYFQHGRFFAAERCRRISAWSRVLRLVTTPVLPLILFWRRVVVVLQKKRHLGKLALSAPLIAFFVVAWAAGELAGYWSGPEWLRKAVYQ